MRDVKLRIYEPPRFFEAFLRGRAFTEAPDITARICGICPVAYQMSSVRAMEDACGVAIDDGPIRELRRLLYCGEWIESHSLHVYLLHAPDFLGYPGFVEMAREHREIAEQGLQMKKAGNALMAAVGGREMHPINVRVGGFYRAPTPTELRALVDAARAGARDRAGHGSLGRRAALPGRRARARARRAARAGPLSDRPGPDRLDAGLDIAPDDFDAHFVEEHVEHSNALHARLTRAGQLPDRSAGPLQPRLRRAAATGPGGGARRRPRAQLPESVPEHHRPCRRARAGAATKRWR